MRPNYAFERPGLPLARARVQGVQGVHYFGPFARLEALRPVKCAT